MLDWIELGHFAHAMQGAIRKRDSSRDHGKSSLMTVSSKSTTRLDL